MDQPSVDGFNTFLVSKLAGRHVKVALSGLGGDEVFAGYPHFKIASDLSSMPRIVGRRIIEALQERYPNRFSNYLQYFGRPSAEITAKLRVINSDYSRQRMLKSCVPLIEPAMGSGSSAYKCTSISRYEISHYLQNTLLRDADALSMWHSVELRPVLLHEDLVSLALSLPDRVKLRRGRLKSVMIDAVEDLVPRHVLSSPKTGFELPFRRWLNGPLRTRFVAALDSDVARRFFTQRHIRDLRDAARKGSLCRSHWLQFVLIEWTRENCL